MVREAPADREYVILANETHVQLHHVTCSRRSTLVAQWRHNYPGGMSLFSIMRYTDAHHLWHLNGGDVNG